MQITITMLTEDLSDAAIETLGEFLAKMTKEEDLNARYTKGPKFNMESLLQKTQEAVQAEQEPVQAEQEAVQAEQEPAQAEPAPAYTLVDIRREANKLIKKDKAKMKEIFSSFGAEKLSEIPEEKYPDLMDKVVSALA